MVLKHLDCVSVSSGLNSKQSAKLCAEAKVHCHYKQKTQHGTASALRALTKGAAAYRLLRAQRDTSRHRRQ